MAVMRIPYNQTGDTTREKGFSLVVVLFFVGLVAAIIALSYANQEGAVKRDQARAAGWHLTQVSRAARIFVRDRSMQASDDFHKTKLATPVPIEVSDLRAAGLLPETFPDTNVMGQPVRIYAANYPVDGDPNSNATAASAYVFLEESPSTRNRPDLMQYLMEGARASGLMAKAPLFNGEDNISDDCGGSPAYASWDTGCLTLAAFSAITGLETFTQGSLIVPAWRSQIHDPRIVTRFPQPENPSAATMTTALEMAPTPRRADGTCQNFVRVRDYTAAGRPETDTDLCQSENDAQANGPLPGGGSHPITGDKRHDFVNVANFEADTVIAEPQQSNAGAMNPHTLYDVSYRGGSRIDENAFVPDATHRTATDETGQTVIYISNSLRTDSNVWATAQMERATIAGGTDLARVAFIGADGTTRRNVQADHNVNIAEDMYVGLADISRVSAANLTNNANSSETIVDKRVSANNINIGNNLVVEDIGGKGSACGPNKANCGVASQVLRVEGGTLQANNATFYNRVNVGDKVVVSSASGNSGAPAMVAYRVEGEGNIDTKAMQSYNTVVMNGSVVINGTTNMTQCFGNCPDMQIDPGDVVLK